MNDKLKKNTRRHRRHTTRSGGGGARRGRGGPAGCWLRPYPARRAGAPPPLTVPPLELRLRLRLHHVAARAPPPPFLPFAAATGQRVPRPHDAAGAAPPWSEAAARRAGSGRHRRCPAPPPPCRRRMAPQLPDCHAAMPCRGRRSSPRRPSSPVDLFL
ncbi:hypothetical protein PVAP13_8NG133209 [Panicum virgatum]|uniref:Uncharacterized protein n=1 Tax=Panicum virgatum TaxID=38727 RepID=A0A8T0PC21_PANVG|nr:hypothetical protein PVAP13_8NG133209 [Panicum virgatum]